MMELSMLLQVNIIILAALCFIGVLYLLARKMAPPPRTSGAAVEPYGSGEKVKIGKLKFRAQMLNFVFMFIVFESLILSILAWQVNPLAVSVYLIVTLFALLATKQCTTVC